MNKTKIEWCDYTWNPIVGCSPVSAGCDHCYAAAVARRFHLPWGEAVFHPERLDQPAKVRKPGRVFVCSMGDIGHSTVKDEWRDAVAAAMLNAPWHTYIVLTKRPGPWLRQLPPTCWVGVTAETQTLADERIPLLLDIPAAVRFVSVEPMLGSIQLRQNWCALDWVIAGPETGPRARRCDDAWIDALAAESPCFFDKRHRWTRRDFPTPNASLEARAGTTNNGGSGDE